MKCNEFMMLLDAYIDNEMCEEARASFEQHAKECAECGEALRAALTLQDAFEDIGFEEDEFEEVAVPLKAQAAWRNAVRTEAKRRKNAVIVRFTSIAAAFVLVLGLTTVFATNQNKGGEPYLAADTADVMESTADVTRMGSVMNFSPDTYARVSVGVSAIADAEKLMENMLPEYNAEIDDKIETENKVEIYITVPVNDADDLLSALSGVGEVVSDISDVAADELQKLCISLELAEG